MTDQDFTKKLSETDIEWHEHLDGGYIAEVNGVKLKLIGFQTIPITLTLTDGVLWKTIAEFGPPPDEEVKKNLRIILQTAEEQFRKRRRNQELYAAYRDGVKQKLYMKVIYRDENPFK